MARILFGAAMNIQAPPNLAAGALPRLIAAGINDWGGVSPVTPDHVNPERPWPALERLAAATAEAGKVLVERLAVYPDFVQRKDRWIASGLRTRVLRMADAEGFARTEEWTPGARASPPPNAGRGSAHRAADADPRSCDGRTRIERRRPDRAVRRARQELSGGLRGR